VPDERVERDRVPVLPLLFRVLAFRALPLLFRVLPLLVLPVLLRREPVDRLPLELRPDEPPELEPLLLAWGIASSLSD
jgi:hypothetical protein